MGYYDTTSGNYGGKYRNEDVDIASCSDGSGCYTVGWITAGEWLAYDVSVGTSGSYQFNVRASTKNTGRTFHIEVDGVNVTGPMVVPNTGSWETWTTISSGSVPIAAGAHTIRIVADSDGFNLNHVTLAAQ